MQKEAHAIAKDHGWWDEERPFGDLIALVHSELSEALEAYRLHELETWPSQDGEIPLGVPFELADVVIRVADMAEWYGVDLQSMVTDLAVSLPWSNTADESKTFGEWITILHMLVTDCFGRQFTREDWHSPLDSGSDFAFVVTVVNAMAKHYGIDLDAAIEAKMEYNRTRPYRHGGKPL